MVSQIRGTVKNPDSFFSWGISPANKYGAFLKPVWAWVKEQNVSLFVLFLLKFFGPILSSISV